MIVDVLIVVVDLIAMLGVAWWLHTRLGEDDSVLFWFALLAKMLAGVALGLIYFEHYGQGDTISYWQDGTKVAEQIFSNPFRTLAFYWDESTYPELSNLLLNEAPRSLFFVKIAGVFAALSGSNYWMMSMFGSFISFLASFYVFERIRQFFPHSKIAASIAIFFWPSIAFWSSGLIKESLGMAAIFLLAGSLLKLIHVNRLKWWEWSLAIVSIWVGWNLKYYWIGIFAPVGAATLLVAWIKQLKPSLVRYDLILWVAAFSILSAAITLFHPNFYVHRFSEVVWTSNQSFMELSDPENVVPYNDLGPSGIQVLANAPKALIAGIFRPFVWEGHNVLSFVAGAENLLLLIAILMALPSLRNFKSSPKRLLTMAVLTYTVLLATFLALSTPNLGTLSRYKIGFLPFFVFLVLYENRFLGHRKG